MNVSKPKILIVHRYCGFIGGIERYIFDTSMLLRENGFELYGLFEEKNEENGHYFEKAFDMTTTVQPGRVETQILEYRRMGVENAFLHKVSVPGIFKVLQRHLTTTLFVHDHDYYCMRLHKYFSFGRMNCRRPFNTLVCSLCDRPLYRNMEGDLRLKPIHPFLKRKLFMASRDCSNFIVLSDHMRDNLIMNGYPQGKIHKIYPVIKNDEVRECEYRPNQLLYIGQIVRGKGVDLLLQALQYLKNDFRLNIVGKGNDENYIKGLINRLGLNQKVTLVPFTLDIGPYYDSAAVVLVPSRWQEPFGLIGGEAYAHLKPVIAFDVGGISEWLEDGVTGYLVRENDIKSFASKIDYLIEHPDIGKKMGMAGNLSVKRKFNGGRFVRDISSLIGVNGCTGY